MLHLSNQVSPPLRSLPGLPQGICLWPGTSWLEGSVVMYFLSSWPAGPGAPPWPCTPPTYRHPAQHQAALGRPQHWEVNEALREPSPAAPAVRQARRAECQHEKAAFRADPPDPWGPGGECPRSPGGDQQTVLRRPHSPPGHPPRGGSLLTWENRAFLWRRGPGSVTEVWSQELVWEGD